MGLLSKLFGRQKQSPDWREYRDPTGRYTLQYPEAWTVSVQDGTLNITSPDESGAVTVSSYSGRPPTPDFPSRWLADAFADEDPMSPREPYSQNGWSGFRQGFASRVGDPRAWLAIVAVLPPVFVLITANDRPDRFRERWNIYGRILDSLQLHRTPTGGEGGVSPR
jgi:hypothetical protein